MNYIFISPHFPKTYWQFADRLKRLGVNVLGIGDAPYKDLPEEVKLSLQEYYYVPNMEDYDSMYRAVGYYAHKYGKIDWIESLNEYWLEQDARLREDFNVKTGFHPEDTAFIKSKALMKEKYDEAGIPSARGTVVTTLDDAKKFIDKTGYPLIAKPENGVGAANVYKIENENDLKHFFDTKPDVSYVMEEFIDGDIVSYDAIFDLDGNPLFESMTEWPPSIADIVNKDLDLAYYVAKDVDPELKKLGRAAVKAFNAQGRFVHLEFFRLKNDKPGLGKKGDYVGLEVNMRPAGGYTPDMMDFAHSQDVYGLYAKMAAGTPMKAPKRDNEYYCVYASQKDSHKYRHYYDDIFDRYKENIVMEDRMPEMMVKTMGNQMYTAKFDTKEQAEEFIRFVQEPA